VGPFDRWREMLETLWRRKLRTALTALSVAWGIFMLVVLLALGRGLANGAQADFAQDALNSVWVAAGRTSRAFEGTRRGTAVKLDNEDEALTRHSVRIIDHSSARLWVGTLTLASGRRHALFDVAGVLPDNQIIEKNDLVAGRFFNERDQEGRRKVAVVGVAVRKALFGPTEEFLGRTILIGPAPFTLVGVIDEEQDEFERRAVYIPLATAQLLRGRGDRIDNYVFTVGDATAAQADDAVEELRRTLAARHHFNPEDKQAVRFWNNQEIFERFRSMFAAIRTFVWIIGLGTVLAGVVGVSNIMLISVQERTREIGVRKALGAQPASIVRMIVEESVVITLVSGYLGLLAAVLLVSTAREAMPVTSFFRNPELDLMAGLGATLVLTVAGTLAGLFPALRAARVNPIAALRVE
jgi:putative ABC transport system permease protein